MAYLNGGDQEGAREMLRQMAPCLEGKFLFFGGGGNVLKMFTNSCLMTFLNQLSKHKLIY